jgi:hypothetical protein
MNGVQLKVIGDDIIGLPGKNFILFSNLDNEITVELEIS